MPICGFSIGARKRKYNPSVNRFTIETFDHNQIVGLDNLLGLLSHIKKEGWRKTFREDNGGDSDLACGQIPNESLPSLLRSLREAKLCLKALDKVYYHLAKHVRSLERQSFPMVLQEGMTCLPDEILVRIFELGHLSTSGSGFSIRVSHVSPRFRELALQTPLLWTRIFNRYSHRQVRTFVSRAGQLDFEISIAGFPHFNFRGLKKFLRYMSRYSTRWSHFYDFRDGGWDLPKSVTTLPRLFYIQFGCNTPILNGLTLPSLSHIRTREYNFRTLAQAPLSQLTSLEMRFVSSELHLAEFTRDLYAMRGLQELLITLERCDYTWPHTRQLSRPDFHSVPINTLSLIISDMTCSHVAQSMFDALSFLRPTHCALSLLNLVINDHLDFFYNGVHDGKLALFPYGSSITVTAYNIVWTKWDYGFDLLTELANSCEIAQRIYIDAPDSRVLCFVADNPVVHYPAYIQLRNCDQLREEDLEKLMVNFLFAEGTGLQRLEILSCAGVSARFLAHLHDKFGDRFHYRSYM